MKEDRRWEGQEQRRARKGLFGHLVRLEAVETVVRPQQEPPSHPLVTCTVFISRNILQRINKYLNPNNNQRMRLEDLSKTSCLTWTTHPLPLQEPTLSQHLRINIKASSFLDFFSFSFEPLWKERVAPRRKSCRAVFLLRFLRARTCSPPPAPEPPCLGWEGHERVAKMFLCKQHFGAKTGAEHILLCLKYFWVDIQAQDVGAHDLLVQAGELVQSILSYVWSIEVPLVNIVICAYSRQSVWVMVECWRPHNFSLILCSTTLKPGPGGISGAYCKRIFSSGENL